ERRGRLEVPQGQGEIMKTEKNRNAETKNNQGGVAENQDHRRRRNFLATNFQHVSSCSERFFTPAKDRATQHLAKGTHLAQGPHPPRSEGKLPTKAKPTLSRIRVECNLLNINNLSKFSC